jgi:hypothetical protein
MVSNTCIEVYTSPEERPSVPQWFAEVVIISRHFMAQGQIDAFTQQLPQVRRFGTYETIDFLIPLLGYAISGEHSLEAFFERVAPFASAFMPLFGRQKLPDRSTLSRFLLAMDRPCLEAFRTLFHRSSLSDGWTSETIGGIFDRQKHRFIVFDVDATRQAARQRALPTDPSFPPARRRLDAVCAPGHKGRRRGEVVRTRTVIHQAHTRQWVGTYAGKGNGDYREELASALRALPIYMQHFALPMQMVIVRLDGLYGDPAVIAQIMEAGVLLLTRGKGYHLLEHPHIQRALAYPPSACVTSQTTGQVVEVFDGGWLPLSSTGPVVRVTVTRHPAPADPKEELAVGTRRGAWVYELFYTTLPAEGFLPADILDLYHGRGSFEAALADEDVEQAVDRWCSSTECGQEFWQIACQWIWNLRLTLGKTMQSDPVLRDIEWAPPAETPDTLVDQPDAPKQYGPWTWAAAPGGSKHPRFGAEKFIMQDDGTLRCPADATLWWSETERDNDWSERAVYHAHRSDCQSCLLREQCLAPRGNGSHGRRVSKSRHLIPPPATIEHHPVVLGAIRWVDVAGRFLRRSWITYWQRQHVEILPLDVTPPPPKPPDRPPRDLRAHRRWRWEDRRAYNAWRGPAQQRILIAGVPAHLARSNG